MGTAELVAEKVRKLPESQAKAVLAFIEDLSDSRGLSAIELMRLPPAERRRILSEQARLAEPHYRGDPDVIAEDADGPLDYEQGATK